ncbi:hypothetical protein NM688_g7312 [Phlebia brevispora]|uniref:Uncharacterized protein n=1 Tax=Phlebia brevispora TaxID=194682 RepID=A0ACC1S6V0_9APHY|nr:hypothetical protein NM688_g7312 [Phlebia brevispora]
MSSAEPKGPNPELVDALRDVAKQLQDISERLSRPTPSTGETDKGAQVESMEEELWEKTRDTVKEQDQVTIDSWKDELNNLLIFAGLFSAVVTPFTVESATWLQQDPGDATNMFLAYISLQISSFVNTPPLINSSAPALPLQNVTSAFTPAAIAAPVNTLWVLSLTLSLMSAFFAITVQQWLRQLGLPADIPIRRAVELLALRADGLKTWQVPGIISLLPLLLQIAVILFLVGLFILLQSLNTTVTISFGAVALPGVLAFLISACIPLINSQCPYKSPFVPTISIVLRLKWLKHIPALVAAGFVLPFRLALNSDGVTGFLFQRSRHPGWRLLIRFRSKCNSLVVHARSFGQHTFFDLGRFWLQREYGHLLTRNDHASGLSQHLGAGLLVCNHSLFTRLISYMRHFSLDEWRGAHQAMVASSLATIPQHHFGDVVDAYGHVSPRVATFIRAWRSSRLSQVSLKALEMRDWKQDGVLSSKDQDALVLFPKLEEYGTRRYIQYVKHLFHICENQKTYPEFCSLPESITPLLILKAFNAGYVPEVGEARKVIRFATDHGTRAAVRNGTRGAAPSNETTAAPSNEPTAAPSSEPTAAQEEYREGNEAHRMLFDSCTAALVAVTYHPTILQEEARRLLNTFTDILCSDGRATEHHKKLKAFYTGHPEYLVRAFKRIPGIHRMLCRALVELARAGVIGYSGCPSIRLVSTLREMYDDINGEDINEARESLHQFWNGLMYNWVRRRGEPLPGALRPQEQEAAPSPSEGDRTLALPPPPHIPQSGNQPPGHDEPSPREGVHEVTGSQNFPYFNNADARRGIAVVL